MFKEIHFRPAIGLRSPHLQMIAAQIFPKGPNPISDPWVINLEDGDKLSCEMSLSPKTGVKPIVVMIHGLGGSHRSCYLIRLARKFNLAGFDALRVNLRGCGSGVGLASRPYNGGTSCDVLEVLKQIKVRFPSSPVILLGFSLGGNIALKLAGELEEKAKNYIDRLIAICPAIDLHNAVQCISKPSSWLYHNYYLTRLLRQAKKLVGPQNVKTIYDFDDKVTAPIWGYQNAVDYYQKCSSLSYLKTIKIPCDLLFAKDDPFIDYKVLHSAHVPPSVKVWLTRYGGHMAYVGWCGKEHGFHWMDSLLLKWVKATSFEETSLHTETLHNCPPIPAEMH